MKDSAPIDDDLATSGELEALELHDYAEQFPKAITANGNSDESYLSVIGNTCGTKCPAWRLTRCERMDIDNDPLAFDAAANKFSTTMRPRFFLRATA